MTICLRDPKTGKIGRVPVSDGVGQPVRFDQDTVDFSSKATLEIHPAGVFFVTFLATNRRLSMNPDTLQCVTRPAGTQDSWESFLASVQPEGKNLLYAAYASPSTWRGPLVFEEVA
jgi:hypothetical protein